MTSQEYPVSAANSSAVQMPSAVLDNCGIAASLACAVHCMAAPFLLLFSPALGLIWSHPAAHWIMAVFVLPLALIVIYRGYRRHRRRLALMAAWLGVAFIVAGLVLPEMNKRSATAPGSHAEAAADSGNHASFALGSSEDHACTIACCPVITYDEATQTSSMSFPPGSIATLIGSVFLVLAHGTNLYGCHCLRHRRKVDAT